MAAGVEIFEMSYWAKQKEKEGYFTWRIGSNEILQLLSCLKHIKSPHSLYKSPNTLIYSNCLVIYDSKCIQKKDKRKE